ncbi:hypothetical protein GOODEAATRI_012417, partial [Goodea atripinnis]
MRHAYMNTPTAAVRLDSCKSSACYVVKCLPFCHVPMCSEMRMRRMQAPLLLPSHILCRCENRNVLHSH